MPWPPTLTTVRNRLATLFPEQTDARLIVDEAGMDSAHISFDAKAINNWHSILGQADLRGKVEAIVTAALSYYPKDQELIDAVAAHKAASDRPVNPPLETHQPPPTAPQTSDSVSPVAGQGGQTTIYQINTGGGAYVGGNVEAGGDFVGRDKISGPISGVTLSAPSLSDSEQSGLLALLAQHQKNLMRLQQQKAQFGAGEEPLRILNQIDHEEEEIARLKAQLGIV